MSRAILLAIAVPSLLAACSGAGNPLPDSVYYQDGPAEASQVWRLEADGTKQVQVTQEEAGVDEFAVSPADGSLAFVSDNQLFLQDGDGQNRRLIADDNQVDKTAVDYWARGFISSPVFSPDGRTLAYAFDGLHLYDLASGEDTHVLNNLGNLLGETYAFDKELYYPGPWSPDGTVLMIIMGYNEGNTLAVMEPGAQQPFRRLRFTEIPCCLFNWSVDSLSVLVSNPWFVTNALPGLWRYEVKTGKETTVVPGIAPGGTNNYAGWPHQLPSGDLLFFFVNQLYSPDVGFPMRMVRSQADGSNRTLLRPEIFHVGEALWAPDGSLAVIQEYAEDGHEQVTLARTDGSPLQVLVEGERIRGLAWGP